MYAIIESCGKQYKVSEGDVVFFEKLDVEEGKSVIMISSEMPELLGMCDRIYVMSEGRIAGEFTAEEATQERIMASIMQEQNKK